jgi:FkbM family methyltransferase
MFNKPNDIVKEKDLILKKIHNSKMYLLKDDPGISQDLLKHDLREVEVTSLLKNYINDGDICIDIGANLGYYVLLERELIGENGFIYCIEPVNRNYQVLQKTIAINNYTNIKCYQLAMGDKNTNSLFLLGPESNSGTMYPSRVAKAKNKDNIITVEEMTLDYFIQSNNLQRVNFIRMDVEGYEYHILPHAYNAFKKFDINLVIEFHIMGSMQTIFDKMIDIINNLYNLDYCVNDIVIAKNNDYLNRKFDYNELLNVLNNEFNQGRKIFHIIFIKR